MKKSVPQIIAPLALATVALIGIALMLGGEFFLWQLDLLCKYKHSFPTETVRGQEITLTQQAGEDFYDTYFLIKSPTGKVTQLVVDGDGHRWLHPRAKVDGDRIYYVDGLGEITDRTSFIDKKQGTVYAGYSRQLLNLP